MKLHFNGYLLYSLSIYHFTLSSADTLLLFLDYKPKSGDSLDTSTDNFTTITENHSSVRNSLKKVFFFSILVQFFVQKLYCDIKKVIGKLLQFRKVHVLWAQNQSTKLPNYVDRLWQKLLRKRASFYAFFQG